MKQKTLRQLERDVADWQRFYRRCRHAHFAAPKVYFRLTGRLRRAEESLREAEMALEFEKAYLAHVAGSKP